MNDIEMKKRALWHLLSSISTAHSAAIDYDSMYATYRLAVHRELTGQLAMLYYLDIIPDSIKTKHTYTIGATTDEYKAMYNDILSLYIECGGYAEYAPKL